MSAAMYDFRVSHPEFGQVTVSGDGAAGATMLAAELWDQKWSKIAGYCDVVKLGRTLKPRCKKCGAEFGGTPGGLCSGCQRVEELWQRDKRNRKKKDRRARSQ